MKFIIFLIVAFFALFAVAFTFKLLSSIKVRDTINGKTTYSFRSITPSKLISSCFWGIVGAVAIVYCCSLIIPLAWSLMTALKTPVDYILNSFGFPKVEKYGLAPENFINVLQRFKLRQGTRIYGLADMLINSMLYAVVPSLSNVFWMTVVAYVMARYKFWGNKALYNLGLIVMLVPIVGNMASSMIIKKALHLYDNMYVSILIPPSTAFSGMHFLILYGAMKVVPFAYSEAAEIDGAGRYSIMFKIIIPMVIPTCATLFILEFIANWNAYENFLIWFPSTPNIAYGMYSFQSAASQGSGAATVPEILAGFIMCMIPSAILYLSSQKLI
ncbi:MAG: carbohydrate ABC transporter permease [Clostridia bacterium]|nr:carbohydrate ABC transporter permease [Clostridia bacterium]